MFRREQEPVLTRQDMNGIIELLMRLDENVETIRHHLVEDDFGKRDTTRWPESSSSGRRVTASSPSSKHVDVLGSAGLRSAS